MFPWASILLHGPLDICLDPLPAAPSTRDPCKNRTHSTCFYSVLLLSKKASPNFNTGAPAASTSLCPVNPVTDLPAPGKDVKSLPWGGEGEADSRERSGGSVPHNPLTILESTAFPFFLKIFRHFPRNFGVLPEDYCKKDPCNFNMEMFVSKVGNPCPTLGQLLSSRILYLEENSTKSPGKDFVHRVAQKLVNSWSSPRQLPIPMESCRGLPCNSSLATPEKKDLCSLDSEDST